MKARKQPFRFELVRGYRWVCYVGDKDYFSLVVNKKNDTVEVDLSGGYWSIVPYGKRGRRWGTMKGAKVIFHYEKPKSLDSA